MRQLEAIAMARDGLSVLELMERAGIACAERIAVLMRSGRFHGCDRFVVLAGMGNNGGDGFVIARSLLLHGFRVRVLRVLHHNGPSSENTSNREKFVACGGIVDDIDHSTMCVDLSHDEMIIDCLFGTGISRPPSGWLAGLLAMINDSGQPIVSIDLPSGMIAPEDGESLRSEVCIRADHTLTFEVPRLGLLLPETGAYAGQFELVHLGLLAEGQHLSDSMTNWVRASDLRGRLRPRQRFDHKGAFGHCLVAAGSSGMYGAAMLALKGCLRSGAGLVTCHLPGQMAAKSPQVAPDAMNSFDPDPKHLSQLPALDRFTAVGIGPGCGQHADTAAMVEQCLRSVQVPVVLDADALNLLALNPIWFGLLGPSIVLTPHPREMDRLLGSPSSTSYDRLRRTRAFTMAHKCTVVLKGAYSATCTSDGTVYFNSTGNAGMAKGGSGDVLTGLLAGLLAQGYSTLDACLIGVFLHGSAGDIAAEELGMDAMRPSDLVEALPAAWQRLRGGLE